MVERKAAATGLAPATLALAAIGADVLAADENDSDVKVAIGEAL